MTTFAYGQDVTLVTRTVTGRDAYGNDVYGETQTVIPNCPVWPLMSSENTQAGDQTVIGYAALLPPGTDAHSVDTVIIAGLRYQIDGEPAVYQSPFTNLNPGVQLNLKRIVG